MRAARGDAPGGAGGGFSGGPPPPDLDDRCGEREGLPTCEGGVCLHVRGEAPTRGVLDLCTLPARGRDSATDARAHVHAAGCRAHTAAASLPSSRLTATSPRAPTPGDGGGGGGGGGELTKPLAQTNRQANGRGSGAHARAHMHTHTRCVGPAQGSRHPMPRSTTLWLIVGSSFCSLTAQGQAQLPEGRSRTAQVVAWKEECAVQVLPVCSQALALERACQLQL